jgi:DNA-binding response OmpR family regulator
MAKVLLVDDEPNILIAIEFLLEQQGMEIRKAFNGQEALATLRDFKPDIVVLDVMMPGLDGFEVAKRIRQKLDYDDVRIVFLTAKGTQNDKLTGYKSGGEIYITKPFDNEHLVSVISEMLVFG